MTPAREFPPSGRINGVDWGILEREPELARLATAAREAADGAGSVALVFGEAGIGKSSLVKAMPDRLPHGTRILLGQCDDLATRRPLGPFRDLIGSVGAELAQAVVEGGDRHRVYEALQEELAGIPHPAVLVVEDVHWADEASLDALRFLVRRMEQLPAVLVLTYRDDELSREHPLRHLLGQVSRADRVHRLPLARLSKSAVHTLSSASRLDPAQVYEVTSGNPFFVAEVLAAGGTGECPRRSSTPCSPGCADSTAGPSTRWNNWPSYRPPSNGLSSTRCWRTESPGWPRPSSVDCSR